jgi:hypothetical protein
MNEERFSSSGQDQNMPSWTLKLTNKIEQGKPAFTPVKTTPPWHTHTPKMSEIKLDQIKPNAQEGFATLPVEPCL